MKRSHLPLNGLRAFEAAARHLSFTGAGLELRVTQAAVSHQVKGLEEVLGVRLFRRLPHGLALREECLVGPRKQIIPVRLPADEQGGLGEKYQVLRLERRFLIRGRELRAGRRPLSIAETREPLFQGTGSIVGEGGDAAWAHGGAASPEVSLPPR